MCCNTLPHTNMLQQMCCNKCAATNVLQHTTTHCKWMWYKCDATFSTAMERCDSFIYMCGMTYSRVLQAEVVQMCCNIFNGDAQTCGTMTSGGTESICMAMKTYRDWAKQTKGIQYPEIVKPTSVSYTLEAHQSDMFLTFNVNKSRACDFPRLSSVLRYDIL